MVEIQYHRFEGVHALPEEIRELLKLIEDENLRSKTEEILESPTLSLEHLQTGCEALSLEECPAGVYQHHAYPGGLLQHTIGVTRISLTLCDLIEEVYGGEVDRDVVVAGAILHDLMKRHSYTHRPGGGYIDSTLGERMDHLSLLVAELYRRGFPLEVMHVVAAHHGDASPVKPKTVEALIVHVADMADSELSGRVLRAAEYLLRQELGGRPRVSSSREALEVVRAKAIGGWEGLRRFLMGLRADKRRDGET